MGVITDKTGLEIVGKIGNLNVDTSGLVKDATAQETNNAIDALKSAVQGLGTALGSDRALIDGSNIANPSAFRSNLGFKSTLLFGTTGNSIYNNFYYCDIELSFSTSKIFSLIITTTNNNRPAFVQILGDTKLRIWSTAPSTDISIKIFYYD